LIRLRGHHLICLFFFEGDTKQDAFELGRQRVLGQCEAGEPVQIVERADDLCLSCRHLAGVRCTLNPGADTEIARLDRVALEGLGMSVGDSLSWRDAASRVIDMPAKWFSRFCGECEWSDRCRMGNLNK
jgi:uncharacterized protein